MIELSKHIELLLQQNDCVIIPEFGGFIAHYTPAKWNPEDGCYLPPSRSIGFNPQLKMNDGLLVQSFMAAYNTSFSDATRIISGKTEELIGLLHHSERVEFGRIGELSYSINGCYLFHPFDNYLVTPSLYGLGSFTICELKTIEQLVARKQPEPAMVQTTRTIHFIPRYAREVAAIAAAVILSFFLSVPAENTYVEIGNYAQLFPANLIELAAKESLANILVGNSETSDTEQSKPVKIKEVKVTEENKVMAEAPAPVITEPSMVNEEKEVNSPQPSSPTVSAPGNSTGAFKLIVGSMSTEKEAEKLVHELTEKGFPYASIVKGDGRIRVSIASFTNREEANKQLTELRKNSKYETAWLLVTQ